MTIVMVQGDDLMVFGFPWGGVQRKHPSRQHALRRQLLKGVLQGGGMGPSTTRDLKTEGSEVTPTNFAIVRG